MRRFLIVCGGLFGIWWGSALLSAQDTLLRERELIIRLKPNISAEPFLSKTNSPSAEWNLLVSSLRMNDWQPINLASKPGSGAANAFVASFDSPQDCQMAAAQLADLPFVTDVQPNYIRTFCDDPTDPLFPEQWNLAQINAPLAWETTTGIPPIILAIIDSGVDYTHPDLIDVMWQNDDEIPENGRDDDQNGYIDDYHGYDFADAPGLPGTGDYLTRDFDPFDENGHGTHVAGIAAAAGNNGQGISGVAPGCRIMALRAGFRTQLGSGFLQDDDIAAAIIYAADNGANVINMSFGDPRISPILRDAVDYAANLQCIVVAAAGNQSGPEILYPAAYDAVIAVGATTAANTLVSTSSYGVGLTVVAPGSGILSTIPGELYGSLSGTSMAAPHVTGVVGLILSNNPLLPPGRIPFILQSHAQDLGEPGPDLYFGGGLVDAAASLQAYQPGLVRIDSPRAGQVVNGPVPIVGLVDDPAFVTYSLSYGEGSFPDVWHLIATAAEANSTPDTLAWLDTQTLPEGPLAIKLVLQSADNPDQVLTKMLTVDHSLPVIVDFHIQTRLLGDRYHYFADWSCTDDVSGRLLLFHETELPIVLSSPFVTHNHTIDLTSSISGAVDDIRLQIQVNNGSGAYTTFPSPTGFYQLADYLADIDEAAISAYGFELRAEIAEGLFLPHYADFDNDQQSELLVMENVSGAYGSVTFYEHGLGNSFSPVFETFLPGLPWAIGDADGDGLTELMLGLAQQITLLESRLEHPFPNNAVWSRNQVWGSRIVDVDGDGQDEIVSRYDPEGTESEGLIIFEGLADNQFSNGLLLTNPTLGFNTIGSEILVADFDGDNRTEIVAYDGDGDLLSFEHQPDGSFTQIWQASFPEADNLTIGRAKDVNHNGLPEFFIILAHENDFEVDNQFWHFVMYESNGDNEYQQTWDINIHGGSGSAGVNSADTDGDSSEELLIYTASDVYLFDYSDNDFRAVFHTTHDQTRHILLADGDGDGLMEMVLNRSGHLQILEQPQPALNPFIPTDLIVRGLSADSIRLSWDLWPGEFLTNIYRSSEDAPAERIVENWPSLSYVDTDLSAQLTYHYQVSSTDEEGRESPLSAPVSIRPSTAPKLLKAAIASPNQVRLEFDQTMRHADFRLDQFRLEGDLLPGSINPIESGQAYLVSYDFLFEPLTIYNLSLVDLTNRYGMLILPNPSIVDLSYEDLEGPRITGVEILARDKIRLNFSEPLTHHQAVDPLNYRCQPELPISAVVMDSTSCLVSFAAEMITNMDYNLAVKGVTDLFGNPFTGNGHIVKFRYAALTNSYCAPNPVRGDQITFFHVPDQAIVKIFNQRGENVATATNTTGTMSLRFPLKNSHGQRLASGIYFYTIISDDGEGRGKFAILK